MPIQASPRIAILLHERQSPRALHRYALGELIEIWRRWGYAVTVSRGTDRPLAADLLLVHVDLSVVPTRYAELARRHPTSVNAGVLDIRRSAFSRNGLDRHPGWAGPVIVKSDLNAFGATETMAGEPWPGRERGPVLGRPLAHALYPSIAAVPARLRGLHDVFIERFVPERAPDCRYAVHYHMVLGGRCVHLRQSSDHYIVSGEHRGALERLDPDPVAIGWCRDLGLQYGKLDYVIHEGEHVLLDVNKTQGHCLISRYPELMMPALADLAHGVESMLGAS